MVAGTLLNARRVDGHRFDGGTVRGALSIARSGLDAGLGNLVDNFQTFIGDRTDVGVVGGQGRVLVVEEELRAVGVGSAVCQSDAATGVGYLRAGDTCVAHWVFIAVAKAGATYAITVGAAALEHVDAIGGQAMAGFAVIEASLCEVLDSVSCTGCSGTVQSDGNVTLVGGEIDRHRAGCRYVGAVR